MNKEIKEKIKDWEKRLRKFCGDKTTPSNSTLYYREGEINDFFSQEKQKWAENK